MKKFFLLFVTLIASFSISALELPEGQFSYRPYGGLVFYVDKNAKLNEDNLLLSIDQFKSHELKVGNFGFTSDTVWAYLPLKSQNDKKVFIDVEYGFHDELEFLHFKDNQLHQKIITGDLLVHSERPLLTNGFSFPLQIDSRSHHQIFLKFKAQESLQVPVSILSEGAYIQKIQRDQIYLGLLCGGILALLLYNLFLWVATLEKAYLTYSVYIFTHMIFQIAYTAIGYQYLWSQWPTFHNYSIPLIGMINIAAFTWFTRNYLRLSWKWEKMDRILMYVGWLALAVAMLQFFVSVQTMIILLVLFHAFLTFLVPIPLFKLILNGDKVALYYLTAFGSLLVSVFINVFAVFGWVSYSEFLFRSPQIGFLIEGVLLSLGLAYRINLLKKAKARAEQEAQDNKYHKELTKLSNQVAHDLKSPMAALQVLGSDQNLNSDFKNMLQSTTERIITIINDLKIQKSKKEEFSLIHMNLNKVIDELIHEKSLEYQERNDVIITAQIPFFTLFYPLQLSMFQRVMSNLINNAVEAKSPIRESIKIEIALQKIVDSFKIEIKDNGTGIPQTEQSKIFEEGVSLGKDDGHGLGLFHAKNALSQMQLSLRICESNEKGTVFEIAPEKPHKSQ